MLRLLCGLLLVSFVSMILLSLPKTPPERRLVRRIAYKPREARIRVWPKPGRGKNIVIVIPYRDREMHYERIMQNLMVKTNFDLVSKQYKTSESSEKVNNEFTVTESNDQENAKMDLDGTILENNEKDEDENMGQKINRIRTKPTKRLESNNQFLNLVK